MKTAVLLMTLISTAFAYEGVRPAKPDQCRQNEIYTQCGSACAATCENWNLPPQPCPMICLSGCICQEPLIRASDGSCVLRQWCPNAIPTGLPTSGLPGSTPTPSGTPSGTPSSTPSVNPGGPIITGTIWTNPGGPMHTATYRA